MKKIIFLIATLISFQCSGNEPEIEIEPPEKIYWNDYIINKMIEAPRIEIPRESLPGFVVDNINSIEDENRGWSVLGYFAQIFRCELNNQTFYFISRPYWCSNLSLGSFYDEEGVLTSTYMYRRPDEFKNWICIFEVGDPEWFYRLVRYL